MLGLGTIAASPLAGSTEAPVPTPLHFRFPGATLNNILLSSANQFTVGSTELFELSVTKDGIIWDLTGGTILFKLIDPNSNLIVVSASPTYNGGAQAQWTVPNRPGNWICAWDITDANGVRQISRPIYFIVTSSPI
jgi:hypothetical protein